MPKAARPTQHPAHIRAFFTAHAILESEQALVAQCLAAATDCFYTEGAIPSGGGPMPSG